jgi:soluble lytic murein transglycosylase
MNRCLRSLSCLLTLSALALFALALFATDATAKTNPKQQAPNKTLAAKKSHDAKKWALPHRNAVEKRRHAKHADAKRKSKRAKDAPAPKKDVKEVKEAAAPLTGDLALVKEAIALARKAKTDEATAMRDKITDPAAQKLVEWFILRHSETRANFSRYAAFIAANPEWPSAALLRRRAEARLWQERRDAATVRGFTGETPISARGKLALARVLLMDGDRAGAGRLAREAWRSDELSERVETDVLEMFRDLLTRDDHRARMDKRIGAKDLAGARRAAKLLGDDGLAIV